MSTLRPTAARGMSLDERRNCWRKKPKKHKDGAALIVAERKRQVKSEGFTRCHDDDSDHQHGELARAAQCYAGANLNANSAMPWQWPATWLVTWWKPSDDPVCNLVKAGALIAAEIDRLQRRKQEAKP